MISAAIAGLGRWGRSLVESVHGKSQRIGFVRAIDTDPAEAGRFAAEQGIPFSTRLEDALDDPAVGAVVLVTPHTLHREQVIASAHAGKHVFCEKPLALNLADARVMIEACRSAGVALGVGHNRRFWPALRELKQIVDSGSLGELLHIEGHNSNEKSNRVQGGWRLLPEESPGGGITGAGLHALDAFIGLFGPVRRVHAQLLSRKPEPAPLDSVCATYEFCNGASGQLATVRATPFYWRIHVFGSKGSAEVLGETELVLRESCTQPRRVRLEPADSLRAELEAFADAAEGRATFPISREQMLATVAAFEATVCAMQSGDTVQVDGP